MVARCELSKIRLEGGELRQESITAAKPAPAPASGLAPEVPSERRTGFAAIISRIDPATAAREAASALRRELPDYAALDEKVLSEHILHLARASVISFIRLVLTGKLADEDLEPIRAMAVTRARQGFPLQQILHAYRIGVRVGWGLISREATEEEGPILTLGADLLLEYLDLLSTAETEAYLEEAKKLETDRARRAGLLLEALGGEEPPSAELGEFAEHLGFPLGRERYCPFALVISGASVSEHARHADELLSSGILAVNHGKEISGLLSEEIRVPDVGDQRKLLALAEPTPRQELGVALEEVRALVPICLRLGLRGQVRTDSMLLELLLARSPRIGRRLHRKVLGPLEQAPSERAQLLKTLEAYVGRRLDRSATARELNVHPNTLDYRLTRIEKLTGLDLKLSRHLALAVLAIQQRWIEQAGTQQPF